MEKVWNSDDLLPKKFKSIMKITLLFLILGILHVSADTYAQKAQVTVEVKSGTFYDVVSEIEKQTEFMFFYKSEDIDNSKQVDIQVKNRQVTDVLNELLKNTNLTYRISGKHITILKKDAVQQQKKKISGTVTDPDGIPVIGANVVIKGTTVGTVTDLDGKFSLDAANNDILSFSYIGYAEQEIEVGNRTLFNVKLAEDYKALEEVVVVGYGTMLKRNLSTSVGSVDSEKLLERPNATNVFQGLAGKVAGVNIALNSGAPGGSPAIKIRGIGSLNSSNTPLYVVDGVVGVDPDQIDPNIVQSIDILKDATSSSIYGARGANGVVVITTKEGKKNTTNISYNTVLSAGTLARKVDVLNAEEALDVFKRAYEAQPGRIAPHLDPSNMFTHKNDLFNPDGTPKYDTDWQDAVTRTAFSHQHSLSFSGGSDKLTAVANVSYKDNQGIMLETYKRQLNAFINVGWDLKEWFHLQAMLNVGSSNARNSENAISRYTLEALPFLPVQYEDGTYSRKGDYPGAEDTENPVRILKERKNIDKKQYTLANVIGTFKITSWLKLTTSFSRQDGSYINSSYNPSTLFGYGDTQKGKAEKAHRNTMSWTNEDYLTFDKSWNKHNLNVVAGASWYYSKTEKSELGAENFFDDYFEYNNMGVGTVRSKVGSDYTDNKMNSYYARINYNFDNRYMVDFNVGYNGSENFAPGHRYGIFPAFSAGWILSEEKFMKNQSFINYLKIRGSYGIVGNDLMNTKSRFFYLPDAYNPYGTSYNFGVDVSGNRDGATELQMGNPLVSWEKAGKQNYGLDFSILDEHLSGSFDYFIEKRHDILTTRNTAPNFIAITMPVVNIGKVDNKGFELVLKWNHSIGDFKYWINGNLSYAKNKIVYKDEIPHKYPWLYETGQSVGQPFGFIFDGFVTEADLESGKLPDHKLDLKPGDAKYKDLNGDNIIDDNDQCPIGNPIYPQLTAGITAGFEYKGFDFSMLWAGSGKVSRFISAGLRVPFGGGNYGLLQYMIDDHWTPETAETAKTPRFSGAANANNYTRNSTLWLKDASYIRLKNVQIGYTFKGEWMKKIHLKNMRIYASGENLLTFDHLKIADPEATDDKQFQYPLQMIFNIGLNLNF